jgi:DNA-binding MarR family transcriptional regulator
VAKPSDIASDSESQHIARLLSRVERDSHVSQRELAQELGVALGLLNTYIKRCVSKGLIKVKQVPSRRYAYFLTPTGFAEKSRLVTEYLYWSLSFFRQARVECTALFAEARRRKWKTAVVVGGGDLAEIAILCAADQGVKIIAVVDAGTDASASLGRASLGRAILGVPVVDSLSAVRPDGWIVTGILDAQALYDTAVAHAGAARVLVPAVLSVRTSGLDADALAKGDAKSEARTSAKTLARTLARNSSN